jgi:cytochrome oxidase assembly protein ShyY1
VILRNRTYGEVPGVHQLVPLRISGSDAAVLVDRGWIPFEFSSPEQRAQFRNATGEVEVQGILRQSQTRRSSLSPADPPLGPERSRLDAWFRVDLPRIQEQMPYRLLPLYLEEETPLGAEARWLPIPTSSWTKARTSFMPCSGSLSLRFCPLGTHFFTTAAPSRPPSSKIEMFL